MKKAMIFVIILVIINISSSKAADEKTVSAMAEFDTIIAEIKTIPSKIDADLCNNDKTAYRQHMTELAQKIIEANTIIKDVKLYYPIDLWSIYNLISYNPTCGAGVRAADAFGVADISRISNEEKMGIKVNEEICMCWNIATGREEPTGYMKDGACRCIYGAGK